MEVAIVTGASSGIGREYVRQLDLLGLDEIWIVARTLKNLDVVREETKTPVLEFPLDLTEKQSFNVLLDELNNRTPNIKYLINNAGFGKFGNYAEVSVDDSDGMIELNNRAMVTLTTIVLPFMNIGSHIINMGSVSAFLPLPNLSVYAATKAFVLNYSYALRRELKSKKITVTAVCPSWVDTNFLSRAYNGKDAHGPKNFDFMSSAKNVVKKALKHAKRNKPISINRFSTKLIRLFAKILPKRLVIAIWMKMQKSRDNNS